MLRVDLKGRRIDASVRALVQQQEGIPRALGPIARVRAELGIERHAHYREHREAAIDDFEAEVQLRHSCEVDGFEVHLRGRADGVIRSGNTLVVEEVKSLGAGRQQLHRLVADSLPAARSQLQLYCLMLAADHPEHAVQARLVIASVIDESWREIPVGWDPQRARRRAAGVRDR